jgi:hypothetical protein
MNLPPRGLLLSCWILLVAGLPARCDDYPISPLQKEHWAWKKPVRHAPPAIKAAGRAANPIDRFLLARLEAQGLSFAPPAEPATLLRRLHLDLVGLPPTPEERAAFLADPSPDAYERVVDRLLASPAHGERWARHWLDVARFAESNGYEHDEVRPDAWRYRDYVVRAFNEDKPYDRFVAEQLAGDELFPGDRDALIATGFNLLGPDMTDSSDQKQRRQNTLNDMTATTSLAFLGLTMGCARCHDHKFEPIPQKDFYRLQAFFTPAEFRSDLPLASAKERAAHARAQARFDQKAKPLRDRLAVLLAPYRRKLREAKLARLGADAREAHRTPAGERTRAQQELVRKTSRLLVVRDREVRRALSPEDRQEEARLQKQLRAVEKRYKPAPLPTAMGLHDGPAGHTFLLEQGDLSRPGEEVRPGFPVVLTPGHHYVAAEVKPTPRGTGRRAALARWVVRRDNPLTARVIVNRVWMHHVGKGLVATPSDFGIRGASPTHPELLDWLAVDFMDSGWSLKRLHRLIVTSQAYQQSCRGSDAAHAKDPDNELLGRMNRVRLEGEVIRDSLLSLAGQLDRRMGSPGVFPPLPEELFKGAKGWRASSDPSAAHRRSLYIFARRNLRYPFLEVFDQPDSNLSCSRRERSTTAPQALTLLNAPAVQEAARACAVRVERESPSTDGRITAAYRLALARDPTSSERALAREFLAEAPLRELFRALFNVNEFVYRE